MVQDLRFKGGIGTRGLMFIPFYGTSRAFIANYSSWREYGKEGRIAEVASSLLSHETLHLAINRFSPKSSAYLDNLFGSSNNWELYRHGLGDYPSPSIRLEEMHHSSKMGRRRRKSRAT